MKESPSSATTSAASPAGAPDWAVVGSVNALAKVRRNASRQAERLISLRKIRSPEATRGALVVARRGFGRAAPAVGRGPKAVVCRQVARARQPRASGVAHAGRRERAARRLEKRPSFDAFPRPPV